ncbi:hypothetical protein [Streptomyces sp. NPDC058623]|uniref:hypothetical protein n=1 Tax=Streptomyces sp. NPDC058623 TaxID=3346563 RepID=UPI003663E038
MAHDPGVQDVTPLNGRSASAGTPPAAGPGAARAEHMPELGRSYGHPPAVGASWDVRACSTARSDTTDGDDDIPDDLWETR